MEELRNLVIGCHSDLVNNLPHVTFNMRRNTVAYLTSEKNGIFATIHIQVPYARYVNYGYENHPNSEKLRRDYKIVERTIRESLRARAGMKGGVVK